MRRRVFASGLLVLVAIAGLQASWPGSATGNPGNGETGNAGLTDDVAAMILDRLTTKCGRETQRWYIFQTGEGQRGVIMELEGFLGFRVVPIKMTPDEARRFGLLRKYELAAVFRSAKFALDGEWQRAVLIQTIGERTSINLWVGETRDKWIWQYKPFDGAVFRKPRSCAYVNRFDPERAEPSPPLQPPRPPSARGG